MKPRTVEERILEALTEPRQDDLIDWKFLPTIQRAKALAAIRRVLREARMTEAIASAELAGAKPRRKKGAKR